MPLNALFRNQTLRCKIIVCIAVVYHTTEMGKLTSVLPGSFHDNLSKNAQIRQRTLTKSIENSENPLF